MFAIYFPGREKPLQRSLWLSCHLERSFLFGCPGEAFDDMDEKEGVVTLKQLNIGVQAESHEPPDALD